MVKRFLLILMALVLYSNTFAIADSNKKADEASFAGKKEVITIDRKQLMEYLEQIVYVARKPNSQYKINQAALSVINPALLKIPFYVIAGGLFVSAALSKNVSKTALTGMITGLALAEGCAHILPQMLNGKGLIKAGWYGHGRFYPYFDLRLVKQMDKISQSDTPLEDLKNIKKTISKDFNDEYSEFTNEWFKETPPLAFFSIMNSMFFPSPILTAASIGTAGFGLSFFSKTKAIGLFLKVTGLSLAISSVINTGMQLVRSRLTAPDYNQYEFEINKCTIPNTDDAIIEESEAEDFIQECQQEYPTYENESLISKMYITWLCYRKYSNKFSSRIPRLNTYEIAYNAGSEFMRFVEALEEKERQGASIVFTDKIDYNLKYDEQLYHVVQAPAPNIPENRINPEKILGSKIKGAYNWSSLLYDPSYVRSFKNFCQYWH